MVEQRVSRHQLGITRRDIRAADRERPWSVLHPHRRHRLRLHRVSRGVLRTRAYQRLQAGTLLLSLSLLLSLPLSLSLSLSLNVHFLTLISMNCQRMNGKEYIHF